MLVNRYVGATYKLHCPTPSAKMMYTSSAHRNTAHRINISHWNDGNIRNCFCGRSTTTDYPSTGSRVTAVVVVNISYCVTYTFSSVIRLFMAASRSTVMAAIINIDYIIHICTECTGARTYTVYVMHIVTITADPLTCSTSCLTADIVYNELLGV